MQTRDFIILSLLLAFGAGVGVVLFSGDSHAIELSPSPADEVGLPAPPDAAVEAIAAPAVASGGAARAEGVFHMSDEVSLVDTTGWEKGIIRGDIQLAVSVLNRIETISVIVEELRSAAGRGEKGERPFKQVVAVKRGVGTPVFEVRDIPFSAYPYAVSVYSPGLNGSRRTLTIDAEHALCDDVVLSITPAAPFSILVRDQDANPYCGVDIRLQPVGDPPGRREHLGKTDNYGGVVFEDVLAGDYEIISGNQGLPLAAPELITVQPGSRMYGNMPQGQGYPLVVPRGVALEVLVADKTGYGLDQAHVRLQALDRTKLCLLEADTDAVGMVTFPHLVPGRWMVLVEKKDHGPWTRPLTIKDGEPLPRLDVTLTRLR
ncbi:MAG: carboxypeptidase regulatory-like domain-containing protein [Planctomycetes bacterium]|nr:carboxypeptidase regulatory-like domain-containing protein [Planctomycetota bacterium]